MSNWLVLRLLHDAPGIAAAIVDDRSASDDREFPFPRSCTGLLYRMNSPDFLPHHCRPLASMAIGSGKEAEKILHLYKPAIACGPPEMVTEWFFDAMVHYLASTPGRGVGGFVLGGVLTDGKVQCLQVSEEVPGEPHRSGIVVRNGRFIVVERSGREIELKWPFELTRDGVGKSLLYDSIHTIPKSNLADLLTRGWVGERPRFTAG